MVGKEDENTEAKTLRFYRYVLETEIKRLQKRIDRLTEEITQVEHWYSENKREGEEHG
jgi:hypothetical protein